MFDQTPTESSSIDTPTSPHHTVQKSKSNISSDEFVTNIYKEKEYNAYNVMSALDMWQSFERNILSEVVQHFSCSSCIAFLFQSSAITASRVFTRRIVHLCSLHGEKKSGI